MILPPSANHPTSHDQGAAARKQATGYSSTHDHRRFETTGCRTVFDQYRWVNNLDRIRKPALERSEVRLRKGSFAKAVRRVARADETMLRIEAGGRATADGECFKCPYRPQCPKARAGWY